MDDVQQKRVFLYSGYTDMRLGIFGLIKLVGKPETDAVYAFCGRNRTTVKLLEFRGSYAWLHVKKLFRGKMNWPVGTDVTGIDMTSLRLLIDSADVVNKVELKGDENLSLF